jgi:lipopolysaccharide transport system ATP-binding protein
MASIRVAALGKAYKQYPTRWSRLGEWLAPSRGPRHQLNWVLRDVTFVVERGEALGVIGANGAGKSTLLKLITGTTQCTTGRVEVSGRVAALLELGMGFHPDFTGRQNVNMAGQLLGLLPDEIATRTPDIEAFAEIGDYFDQPVRIYSSGMQVRLAFSVATARRPDVLIVDEALSVGDAHFQRKSFGRIREFQERGTTLLLVSHDLAAIRSVCSRALWLGRGIVMAHGGTQGVVDEYAASVYSHKQNVSRARERSAGPEHGHADAPASALDRRADKWGNGDIRITSAVLQTESGRPLSWVRGGERARVLVTAVAALDKASVFVGFMVKDRVGQPLFGDNTYLRYLGQPVSLASGTELTACFEFSMPVLPSGTYAISVAVASGTQEDHVLEEWIEEALHFESHSGSTVQGMVGIPMHQVYLGASHAPRQPPEARDAP